MSVVLCIMVNTTAIHNVKCLIKYCSKLTTGVYITEIFVVVISVN